MIRAEPGALAHVADQEPGVVAEPDFSNRFRRADARLRRLPRWLRRLVITWGFRLGVPFFGAARAHILEVEPHEVVVRVPSRRQVRNHVGGVHAVAMALSAETATGILVGMNLQDRVVPLLSRMHIRYVHRSQGALTARAWLSPAQQHQLRTTTRGELQVPVEVHDETGAVPIVCEMVWAWRMLRS